MIYSSSKERNLSKKTHLVSKSENLINFLKTFFSDFIEGKIRFI